MNTYINQYFIYGISVLYNWYKKWEEETGNDFYETFKGFIKNNYKNIHCLFDSHDGRYFIIGKILKKLKKKQRLLGNEEPLIVPKN